MSHHSDRSSGKSASVLNFLVTTTLAILFFIYFSIMAYTKDAMWFYPVFDSTPVRVEIRCYGEQVVLEDGTESLLAISSLMNEQISGDKRWDELNLTNQTYQDYQTSEKMMILELFYNEPQRIHSRSPFFSGFTSLLIPLDGRYSDVNIMFSLRNGKPSGSSFHLTTLEPVKSYIEDNNLCKKP